MDISVLFSLLLIFLPLFLAIFLIVTKIRLIFVSKFLLNNGAIIINSISLFCLLALSYFVFYKSYNINFLINLFDVDDICINFDIAINKSSILYLFFANISFMIISIFTKKLFLARKQFLFTKYRFYIYFSTLIFITNYYICSNNMLQSLILWIIQALIIYIFSYIDIFKENNNYNITRFYKISFLGDFTFLSGFLILYKYALLSDGFISSLCINYPELNALISYIYGTSSSIEFKILFLCFVVAIITKLTIFPFNCYFSFFANSSNCLFISILNSTNLILGFILFSKLNIFSNFISHYSIIFTALSALTIVYAIYSILFEKNIKIILGYMQSIINAIFIIIFGYFSNAYIYFVCFGINILYLAYATDILLKNRINLRIKLLIKHHGFLLEKFHIYCFENFVYSIGNIVDILDKILIQNIINIIIFPLKKINKSIIEIKKIKTDKIHTTKKIMVFFALYAILIILLVLFGGIEW